MRRIVAVFIPLALVVAACGSDDGVTTTEATDVVTEESIADSTPADTEPATTEPAASEPPESEPPATEAPITEPPATDPAEAELAELPSIGHGEYAVGVSTITITDTERDRPLTVDVWFPLADGVTGDAHRYTFVTGDYYESPFAVTADATSISADGPFPLVVYSHGSGGVRYIHSNYTETLASHGYLVVAADHTGNTAVERVTDSSDDGETISFNRPTDVKVVIDAMLNPESTETVGFVASVDPESIAVTGHSFGGFTTYAIASGYTNDVGTVAADPRVDAIIPLAPATNSISDELLASITIPALVMVGTNDMTTPVDPNVTRAWDLTNSAPSYRLELVDGQHNTFTDLCAYLDFFPQLPNVNEVVLEVIESQAVEGCSEGDMEIPRAQELTNTFAVTFLDSVFGDATMFTPDAYAIPDDVVYFVK